MCLSACGKVFILENFRQIVNKMIKCQRPNCPDLGTACGLELNVGGVDAVATCVKEAVVAEPPSGCIAKVHPGKIKMAEFGLVRDNVDVGAVLATGNKKIFDAGHRRRQADVIAVNLTLQALPFLFAAGAIAQEISKRRFIAVEAIIDKSNLARDHREDIVVVSYCVVEIDANAHNVDLTSVSLVALV